MIDDISLREVLSLPIELQLKLRALRNKPQICTAMFRDSEISLAEHLEWLNELKSNERTLAFVAIQSKEVPVGFVSLNHIDFANKRASWAFYVDSDRCPGLGPILEFHAIDFAFETLKLEKLSCEVLEGNQRALRLHRQFCFGIEGFRESEIVRDSQRLGVYLLGLRREIWNDCRNDLLERHLWLKTSSLDLIWRGRGPVEKSSLDRIEAARARNNLNWMAILRIATERSPVVAGEIITEIKRLDREISSLTEDLISSLGLPKHGSEGDIG